MMEQRLMKNIMRLVVMASMTAITVYLQLVFA